MKILFFCTDPLRYDAKSKNFQLGGGWVTAVLQGLQRRCPQWILGIGCEGTGAWGEVVSGFHRFPMDAFRKKINKLKRKLNPAREADLILPQIRKCVEDFQPDAIMVFGSETPFGLISKYTEIPVILHLQGFLTAYQNALLPPGISRATLYRAAFPSLKRLFWQWYYFRVFRANANREIDILTHCMHYFGRTQWDRAVLRQYNPRAEYTECWELLRECFYQNAGTWKKHDAGRMRIVSTISTPVYKGADLILKTARLLKDRGADFSWDVIGIGGASFFENLLQIKAQDVNVHFCGTIQNPDNLVRKLLDSDVYVHPSYIENSPNSLCEAQILGLPVIAVASGGVPSLVEHMKTGLLVPANDPYVLAERITQLLPDDALIQKLSRNGFQAASGRHSKEKILDVIIAEFQHISGSECGNVSPTA